MKPPFYAGTAPDAWLKTPRTSDDSVRQAYAGTHFKTEKGMGSAICWTVVLLLLVVWGPPYVVRMFA